jgi:myo-inositol-1(or 4)-monophosphatase
MSVVMPALLYEIEATAVELAALAAREIVAAFGRGPAVSYKDADSIAPRDPVSEVDHKVERLIRARLATRFPTHAVIGEELDEPATDVENLAWVLDPVDGTMNFVNGYPLFAASIGVIAAGRPIVGAVWCSTSHVLRPGTYHAREGGPLRFDGETVPPRNLSGVRRYIGAEPSAANAGRFPWELRITGSAAIECAFVAAGLLRVSRLGRPSIWDVAGGLPLLRAAGRTMLEGREEGWAPFERFSPPTSGDLRQWRRAMILGAEDEAAIMARENSPAQPAAPSSLRPTS